MLKIFNSISRKKEKFVAIKPSEVSIYVCGMTVYDFCHIGHARVMVVFDMIVRYLRSSGFFVHYVRNITDIDDKIIARANENNESINELTERFINAMTEDATSLGVLPPDEEPRATDHIDQIIDMISILVEKKHAYVGDNMDVYFDVGSFKEYGKLSGKCLDDLIAGERVEVQEEKRSPLDFVLWKSAKPNEPSWSSPWGDGRPGWHIECSAMSVYCLGKNFDIHGGGQDLQFPHHENEIAQSICSTGGKFANTWIHNGFVRFNEEKMSKSLGNFFTLREVSRDFQAEVIRFFILSSHYRSPLNYSKDNLKEAKSALDRLYTALFHSPNNNDSVNANQCDSEALLRFSEHMDDDFNTPRAISLLHEIAHNLNKENDKTSIRAIELTNTLKYLGSVLGLLQDNPQLFLQGRTNVTNLDSDIELIENLIKERNDAKSKKDYVKADQIRSKLNSMNISLEDTAHGTNWKRK